MFRALAVIGGVLSVIAFSIAVGSRGWMDVSYTGVRADVGLFKTELTYSTGQEDVIDTPDFYRNTGGDRETIDKNTAVICLTIGAAVMSGLGLFLLGLVPPVAALAQLIGFAAGIAATGIFADIFHNDYDDDGELNYSFGLLIVGWGLAILTCIFTLCAASIKA